MGRTQGAKICMVCVIHIFKINSFDYFITHLWIGNKFYKFYHIGIANFIYLASYQLRLLN